MVADPVGLVPNRIYAVINSHYTVQINEIDVKNRLLTEIPIENGLECAVWRQGQQRKKKEKKEECEQFPAVNRQAFVGTTVIEKNLQESLSLRDCVISENNRFCIPLIKHCLLLRYL